MMHVLSNGLMQSYILLHVKQYVYMIDQKNVQLRFHLDVLPLVVTSVKKVYVLLPVVILPV